MDVKRCFQVVPHCRYSSIALLLLRLAAGVAFILHGWGKILSPMSWMGPESAIPGVFQMLAAVAEFGGGIAWVVGLLMPLSSLGMFFTMLVATYFHAIMRGDPFVGKGGPSYELALIYLVISLLFLVMGPGKYSLDKVIFGEKSRN